VRHCQGGTARRGSELTFDSSKQERGHCRRPVIGGKGGRKATLRVGTKKKARDKTEGVGRNHWEG